jgi:hypothetical protein
VYNLYLEYLPNKLIKQLINISKINIYIIMEFDCVFKMELKNRKKMRMKTYPHAARITRVVVVVTQTAALLAL